MVPRGSGGLPGEKLIARDGLARIEFVWIVPGRARIARAEVDLGEQTWNYGNRLRASPRRGGAPGAGRRLPWPDTVWTRLWIISGPPRAPHKFHTSIEPGAAIREHVT